MITAPYNFVPLNKKVFFPFWSEQVSHDIPFKEAESGEIEIEIETKSPTFIKDHETEKRFCQYDGKYYIPATSLKGMIRNIVEIMSFSKMSFINGTTYSLRDLKYDPYLKQFQKNQVQCGWLYKNTDGELKIESCATPYRIKYDEIDKGLGVEFKKHFLKGTFDNSKSPYKQAKEKYALLSKLSGKEILNSSFSFTLHSTDAAGRAKVAFDPKGSIQGKLVLTGHPSERNEQVHKASGKIYDFVFAETKNPKIYKVDKQVFENFKFAYFDGRDTQPKESPDWSFWKKRLNQGEKVPVFFHLSESHNSVASFGLSYLYKFPYPHSILDVIFKDHTAEKPDLAETIFGFSRKSGAKQLSLKGRVYFSHAPAVGNVRELPERDVLLGMPKASYYPIYLVQNGKEYKTLLDGNAILAGWKRYPVHQTFTHSGDTPSTQTTTITPLAEGTRFHAKIKLHNLTKTEIGALLSALTFHQCQKCFHNIGMAKPLGYGKIKITVTALHNLKHSAEEYMKAFEACMNAEIFKGELQWHQCEQITNLLTMAVPQNDKNLRYMTLKEFSKEKKNKNHLDRYVNLPGVTPVEAQPLCSEADIQNYNKKLREQKLKKELQQKEMEAKRRYNEAFQKLQYLLHKDILELTESEIQEAERFIKTYTEDEKAKELQKIVNDARESKKVQKHQKVNEKAQQAWNELLKKKGNQKQFKKELEKFIKKWSKEQNHKGSSFILELVQKAKEL